MNIEIHIYKFICILLCTHIYIHNHTYTYKLWYSACFTHYVGLFSFGSTQNSGKFSVSTAIFILNTQGCNTVLPIH